MFFIYLLPVVDEWNLAELLTFSMTILQYLFAWNAYCITTIILSKTQMLGNLSLKDEVKIQTLHE